MTIHEVVHKMVVGECHEPNSKGSGSAWMEYMNARIAGLFLLVLWEYPNGIGVVRATSRGLDMALHWGAALTPDQCSAISSPLLVVCTTPLPLGYSNKTNRGAAPTPDQCSAISSHLLVVRTTPLPLGYSNKTNRYKLAILAFMYAIQAEPNPLKFGS
nr:hypothetical protein [Tanacetum cinerariifolium]